MKINRKARSVDDGIEAGLFAPQFATPDASGADGKRITRNLLVWAVCLHIFLMGSQSFAKLDKRSPATAVAVLSRGDKMKVRKTVTAAKVAANQKNSELSTGPTSVRGKAVSRWNSISHGILTGDLLLPDESGTDLEKFRDEMISSYCPVGRNEFQQVEIIVWNLWRLKRLCRAENSEISKVLADRRPAAEIAASAHTPLYQQAAADRAKLESIEAQIIWEGRVSEEDLGWIRGLPYGEPVGVLVESIELTQAAVSGKGESPSTEIAGTAESQSQSSAQDAIPSKEERRQVRSFLLSGLDSLKETIEQAQVRHGQYIYSKVTAQCDAVLVPQEAVLNRLTRYENHLLRNLYRAEHELERMQRLRFGDEVAPPSARVD